MKIEVEWVTGNLSSELKISSATRRNNKTIAYIGRDLLGKYVSNICTLENCETLSEAKTYTEKMIANKR